MQLLNKLMTEILEDVRRLSLNTFELKDLLYHMGDDDPGAPLCDWEWRWPPGAVSMQPLMNAFDDGRWRRHASSELSGKVDELYDLFADQPPDLSRCAEELAGQGNSFYVFLFDKLDEREARVKELAAEIQTLVNDRLRAGSAAG